MATFGAFPASDAVNSRPAINGTPSVRKYPGPTSLNRALVSVSGPALNPSTATLLPQLLPAMSGTRSAVTLVTPGNALRSDSSRSNSAIERCDV